MSYLSHSSWCNNLSPQILLCVKAEVTQNQNIDIRSLILKADQSPWRFCDTTCNCKVIATFSVNPSYLKLICSIWRYGFIMLFIWLYKYHTKFFWIVSSKSFGHIKISSTWRKWHTNASGWRKMHNEELHNIYSSPYTIRTIKSRKKMWAVYTVGNGVSQKMGGVKWAKKMGGVKCAKKFL